MIEQDLAQSGHKILKKNGRLLASGVDPIKEAQTWAKHVCAGLTSVKTVVVLGLGAGYHVLELRKEWASGRVFVIDCDADVVGNCLEINTAIDSSDVVVEPDWTAIAKHGSVRDALGSIFHIAQHGPSCQIDAEYFSRVNEFLLGREKNAFRMQLNARPEIAALFDQEALAKLGDELISIKTIQKLFQSEACTSRERKIWSVLGELVR